MGRQRRVVSTLAAVATLAIVTVGMGVALAQSDGDAATGASPQALLERLGALEPQLPADPPPIGAELSADTTWGTLEGDATSVRAVLDTLEPDLRALYVDADDADGDVAEAVASVALGWLDVWTGTSSIATAESHDLAFPVGTTDDQGVATGADELRGEIEVGLDLLLLGRARHLEGYGALSELGEAEPAIQRAFDERARAAEDYDAEVRPVIAAMLSDLSPSVLVPVERFDTDAPGVQSRATSVGVVCVDRAALEELGGVATPEVLAQLEEIERDDCADLPGSGE